jgi:uncharacterized protein
MDPLAELVKLDPKSIGVGQYQHDVDEFALKRGLDDTVVSCVNRVGVELNTASKQLLSYVSGLGPALAANIVAYRNENGPSAPARTCSRSPPRPQGLRTMRRLPAHSRRRTPARRQRRPPRTLRTRRHHRPDLGCGVQDLLRDPSLRSRIQPEKYVTEPSVCPPSRTFSTNSPAPDAIRASSSRSSPSRKASKKWRTSSRA